MKFMEGVMVADDWVIMECVKDNIAHRLRYQPEIGVFNIIFKYFPHIKDVMFKVKVTHMSRLAVDRVKFVQILPQLGEARFINDINKYFSRRFSF